MSGIRIDVSTIPFATAAEAAAAGPRLRTSEYFITMSTNVRFDAPPSEVKAYADRLIEGIVPVFSTDENLRQFVKFPVTKEGVVGRWEPGFIESVKVTMHAEIGLDAKHGRRLHAHVLFKVIHRCRTRLDYIALKGLINRSLEKLHFQWPVRYMHCRLINNAAEDYMHK